MARFFKVYETKPFVSAKYGSGGLITVGVAHWPEDKEERMEEVLRLMREHKPDSVFEVETHETT